MSELESVPGFLFFDHVAIAVKPGELEAHVHAYQAMGFEEVHREDVLGGDQVREVLLQVGKGPNLVQLLEPLTPESPVAKQIEKNGGRGGMAHVALRVTDIQKAFDHLKQNGFKIIDKAPRKGSRGTTVFFVHPKSTEQAAFGYLLEVVQEELMPEAQVGNAILNLGEDFPPVATPAWEAAIAKDLKGADYEKKLVWRTEEGLAVRPYYRTEALTALDAQLRTSPGAYPYVRGTGASWEIAQDTAIASDAIRVDLLHEAGAHATQELGYGIAAGIEQLAALTATLPVDQAVQQIEFVFAVGPNYFIEIAKLRAARLLWAQAVAAFGLADPAAGRMRLHVRTPQRNKSAYDRYTNLLRVTTEAMAAAVGGCDRLTVEPFGFDPHLALNVQRILKEEAHLDAVADPAGGSYYLEALTDALAREGWALLQKTEAEGGYAKALESGSIEKALAETRLAREKSYSARRRALVGVNNFPDSNEKTPAAIPAAPEGPLPEMRIAEPYEQIRRRTAEHALATGRYPKVLLLKRGDVKMKGARSNFCFNFFGCAGFDMLESEDYAGTDADLIVLCSSDPEYLAFAQEVCAGVTAPVLVAGNPKEQIEALRAAGVQGFIHIFSDAIETLTEWQNRLGMRSTQ